MRSFLRATHERADDAAAAGSSTPSPPLINCLMLITWPQRREMIQHAIASFACQNYVHRVLTLVNDGEPCELSNNFFSNEKKLRGTVLQAPPGSSIGEKRNLGAKVWPEASYVASFDDDDFSLPGRLDAHLAAIGDAVWLSASRKFISLASLENIIGFEVGRCYGAGMVSTRVTRALAWPALSYCEDHKLYESVKAHPEFGALIVDDDALMYVHRRHETNASARHRQSLWQGVMPLMIAGAEAMGAPKVVAALIAAAPREPYLMDSAGGNSPPG